MIPNEWIRIVSGALLVILMAKVLGTTDYLGAGMDVVERAVMDGKVAASAFLLKIIFTAVTLGCGFRGGEIVPTLFVGATFGCLFGQITGLSPAGLRGSFCPYLAWTFNHRPGRLFLFYHLADNMQADFADLIQRS